MNQHDQMMSEVLQAIETVLGDAYHRRFPECCGRGQGDCCGDFVEQWTPEDHKILDVLSPIQRQLSQALAAEPAKLVRLADDVLLDIHRKATETWLAQDCSPRIGIIFGNAIMDAMERVNGGSNATD